jgi:quercetin dioxygenase-like cupin family protein
VTIPGPDAHPVAEERSDLTRRTLLGAGTTGLALALLARTVSQAAAQDATPAAQGGMPEGLAAFPLMNIPVPAEDVPAGGFTLSIARLTFEPGTEAPVGTLAYPEMAYVESGTLMCPGGATRYIIAADGSVREIGEGEFPVNTGETVYVPPGVPDGGRNDGPDKLSLLIIDLLPKEEMATPSA